jgi:hypothetical protein
MAEFKTSDRKNEQNSDRNEQTSLDDAELAAVVGGSLSAAEVKTCSRSRPLALTTSPDSGFSVLAVCTKGRLTWRPLSSCRQKCDGQHGEPASNHQRSHRPGGYVSLLFGSIFMGFQTT